MYFCWGNNFIIKRTAVLSFWCGFRFYLSRMMWIRIRLFTWCGSGSSNLRPLAYRLSKAPFWVSMHPLRTSSESGFSLLCGSESGFSEWCGSKSALLFTRTFPGKCFSLGTATLEQGHNVIRIHEWNRNSKLSFTDEKETMEEVIRDEREQKTIQVSILYYYDLWVCVQWIRLELLWFVYIAWQGWFLNSFAVFSLMK